MEVYDEAIERILNITEQICKKLQIAICLPVLVKQEKFKNIFKDNSEDFDSLYKICNSTNLSHEYTITEKCSSIDDVFKQASRNAQLHNKHAKVKLQLAMILMRIYKYEDEIMPIVDDNLDEIASKFKKTVEHIKFLKRVVEWQMRMTPRLLREYKAKLRNAKVLIAISQEEIQKLDSDFNDQTLRHNDTVKEYRDEIMNLNRVIDEIKKTRNEELDREVNSYKTKLCGLREDVDEKENNLNNQLEAHEAMLEKLMLVDIEQERLLREERKRAEKKYLAALNAFDHDLSKLDELKETLKMQLSVINNHYDVLKNEYDVQSVLYAKLKKERELAIMQAFAHQLENFEKNRAARIIQRTWRAYRERKSSKKKKKTRRNK